LAPVLTILACVVFLLPDPHATRWFLGVVGAAIINVMVLGVAAWVHFERVNRRAARGAARAGGE